MIPKIIHYIWLDKSENEKIKFSHLIQMCIMSARIANPDYRIIIHTNKDIEWEMLKKEDFELDILPNEMMEAGYKIGISNENYYYNLAHMSDWVRYNYLYDQGGIYIDIDIVVLKSFDDLLDKHYVVAQETSKSICVGVILSRKGEDILKKILYDYVTDYRYEEWVYNSQVKPLEHIKEDSTCTILDRMDGFHYPYFGEFRFFETPCERIDSEKDIQKYFKCRGHHFFNHLRETAKYQKQFVNATDKVYIAQLGNYILRKYGVIEDTPPIKQDLYSE